MQRKVYECCICHKIMQDTRPIRLVEQHHDNKETYGSFVYVRNHDFCRQCFSKFIAWIKKHE